MKYWNVSVVTTKIATIYGLEISIWPLLIENVGSQILTEPGSCRSDLIQIDLKEDQGYVQSRWNMVESLTGLPWAPMIDVVGRTKFWYRRTTENDGYQVYFYDEEWEIPAAKALLQLITRQVPSRTQASNKILFIQIPYGFSPQLDL